MLCTCINFIEISLGQDEEVPESTSEESKDVSADKPAEQIDLTDGDGKAEDDKADEAKPEESDTTASRKRPREDEEGIYYKV